MYDCCSGTYLCYHYNEFASICFSNNWIILITVKDTKGSYVAKKSNKCHMPQSYWGHLAVFGEDDTSPAHGMDGNFRKSKTGQYLSIFCHPTIIYFFLVPEQGDMPQVCNKVIRICTRHKALMKVSDSQSLVFSFSFIYHSLSRRTWASLFGVSVLFLFWLSLM